MQKPDSLHVDKPWGSFDHYALNTPCTVKILTCNPGQQVSLGIFDEMDIERLQDDYGRR